MSVTLINQFTVPAGRDEQFLALWRPVNDVMRAQPGYRAHALHRALGPDAAGRYVNVATWASMEDFRAAHAAPAFRELTARPEWAEFPSRPAVYEVVDAAAAEEALS